MVMMTLTQELPLEIQTRHVAFLPVELGRDINRETGVTIFDADHGPFVAKTKPFEQEPEKITGFCKYLFTSHNYFLCEAKFRD